MTDRWREIDEHIVNHRVLQALMTLRETFGYSIPQAIESFDSTTGITTSGRRGRTTSS